MARFLHIADCHLGCRQYGMRQREEDFYAAFADAADKAVANKVDAVVIAGDLFDSVKPSAEAVYIVKKIVSGLKDSGIAVLGVEGNHDLTGDGYWLEVCGIRPLTESMGTMCEAMVGGTVFAGLPYMHPEQLVEALNRSADAGFRADVVVLHAGFAELGDSYSGELSVQAVLPALKRMGARYVALGHIHVPLEPVFDGVHFVQPGSTEVKDIAESPDKHAVLAEVGASVSHSVVPLSTRPVEVVNVASEDDLHRLVEDADSLSGRLVVADVSSAVPDGAKRIEEALSRKGAMFRIRQYDDSVGRSVAGPEYDRDGAIPTLSEAISEFFEEGSDQHRLVSQILSMPGNLRKIAEDYINQKDNQG